METPTGYTAEIVEALHEAGDPVSVDAAEHLTRLWNALRLIHGQNVAEAAYDIYEARAIAGDALQPNTISTNTKK